MSYAAIGTSQWQEILEFQGDKSMVKASETRHAAPEPQLMDWPDSGGVARITWHTASGEVYQQELASRAEAEQLLAKIGSNDELTLVSAQVRRVGIGPDS